MTTEGTKTRGEWRWRPSRLRRLAVERRAALRSLPQVTLGLAIVHGVLTPLPALRAGTLAGGALTAVTAAMALAMVWLRRRVLRGRLPHRWAHAALGLALATLVVRGLLGRMLFGTEQEVALLGIIALAIGFVCVSAIWTGALLVGLELGWPAVLYALAQPRPPAYAMLLVTAAAPVAVAIRGLRLQGVWREEQRRRHDLRRQAQLVAATARASESERRFRGIFERIHDVYLRVDLDGRVEMVSPSVARFGYQPHELIGTDIRACFAPRDVERGQALITQKRPADDIEMRWRAGDGREIVVSVSGSVLRDAAGTPIGYEGILRDISERKRLEAERREQEAELAHVLRLSSMGEMAAEMAHELTQPLAAIVNYAGACTRYVRGMREERAKLLQGLELISAQGLRAGEIVHRIRSYVAKRPPQREVADLVALAADAVHTVAGKAQQARLPILMHGSAGIWFASVDAIQIEQVIVNLLLNALEAVAAPHEEDGIAVWIGKTAEGEVEISVSDPGIGLGALAGRVFDPFFSTKPSGLGMGLAISRSIVESHGGRLWATPNPERGTTFHLTLPRVPLAPRDQREPAATVHLRRRPLASGPDRAALPRRGW